MAEVSVPSGAVNLIENPSVSSQEVGDCTEPPLKKSKIDVTEEQQQGEDLEQRLNDILCCSVCLDLPVNLVYQCVNGHLMCAGCFTHVLADARLKDEQSTCPNCRCEIGKTLCSRNLAVEKTVSELPSLCEHCSCKLPRNVLEHHQRSDCPQREDYFNRQRVENEFDPSGKGIHTTTPLVVQLELSYFQAAEQQWKAKKKDARQKNPDTKQDKKETQKSRDGDKSNETEVSPRIKKNSKIKSRVKGSEIERITKNAQTAMSEVSVDRIHSVHRYRPHLTPQEYVDLGKVAHVSPHVNAILNTEYAWKSAEDNDDREAARKYVQEKNESKAKEKDDKNEERPTSTNSTERTPLWLRVSRESQLNKENITGEPNQESDGATEDVDDVSTNDKTRRHDGDDEDDDNDGLDDKLQEEDQDILTSTDDIKDTTSDHDQGNGDIESGGNDDAGHDNPKDDIQDVERETGAKDGETIEESDIKEHECDNERHEGPDGKDEHKSEEYIRTESMLSLTTVDNT